MDEIFNKGIESISHIFQVGYEIDNMYFVLGFFKTEKDAVRHFKIVKNKPEKYIEYADSLHIRKFQLEKLQSGYLEPQTIEEMEF